MRDLEIRGAGNLLGGAQSGHIAAVGFDLYCELVTEAVDELKGETAGRAVRGRARPARRRAPPTRLRRARRRADGGLPPARGSRRPRPTWRTSAWSGRTATDRSRAPAEALLGVARLRAECVRVRVTSVSVQKGVARIEGLDLPESRKVRLQRLSPKAVAKDGRRAGGAHRRPAARGGRRARRPARASSSTEPAPSLGPGSGRSRTHGPPVGSRPS